MSATERNLLAGRPTPAEVASLLDEASGRARALVLGELVDQLVERYRRSVRSALDVESFPSEELPTSFAPGQVPRARDGGTETAWYVYAILRGADHASGRSLPAPIELPAGVEGATVELLDAGDLTVAVSEVPLAGFRASDQDPDLSAHGWLRAAVGAHERVVERLARDQTVLPFRFGALYSSRDDARKIALTDANRLSAELDRLDGAGEWGVKAYVESPTDSTEQVPAYLDEPATGTTWMMRRREAAAARDKAGRLRGTVAAALEDALAGYARDVVVRFSARVGHPASGQAAGRGGLAFDGVYLVSHTRQDEFDTALREVARQYAADDLRVEVSGPWPAYHFVRMPTGSGQARTPPPPRTGTSPPETGAS
jgi:hypothetical protein